MQNTTGSVYHSESDVSFLESRSIIGAVAGDCHNLSVWVETTVNDAFHQSVLVLRR